MMYVLFGPPGVGKTYIGQLLSDTFDYFFFDADQLYDEHLRTKIQNKSYSQADRNEFIGKLIKALSDIVSTTNKNIVVAEAFTIDENRRKFLDYYPDSKFIFVNASKDVAEKRMRCRLLREKHIIEEEAFNRFWVEFEKPTVEYSVIDNVGRDNSDLIKNFVEITEG